MSITLNDMMKLVMSSGGEKLVINFSRPVAGHRAGTFIAITPRTVTQADLSSIETILHEPIHSIGVYNNMLSVDV